MLLGASEVPAAVPVEVETSSLGFAPAVAPLFHLIG
jgi:hypothetical protein